MYLAQLLTGQDAINCFNRGVNIMKEELRRDHPELTKEDEVSGLFDIFWSSKSIYF